MRVLCVVNKLDVIVIAHPASFVQICNDDAGIYSIYPDTLWSKLESGATCKLVGRGLRNTIREHVREGPATGHTRDVNDISLGRLQVRNALLDKVKSRPEVDVHHFVPVVQSGVF